MWHAPVFYELIEKIFGGILYFEEIYKWSKYRSCYNIENSRIGTMQLNNHKWP